MSNALKCPNPNCPYLFDPTRVPAGVVLSCPRCGMQFTLAAPPQPTPPAGFGPPSGFPGYPPQPGHRPPPVPAGSAHLPPDAGLTFDTRSTSAPSLARRAKPDAPADSPAVESPAAGRDKRLIWLGGGVLAVAVVVTAVILAGRTNTPAGDPATAATLSNFDLGFDPPPAPWVKDDAARVKLGRPVVLVYRRADPEAYMAVGAAELKSWPPKQPELEDGLTQPLRAWFDDLQWLSKADAWRDTSATWLGQPAAHLTFQAQAKGGGVIFGDCHVTSAKGVGYWYMCWAPEGELNGQLPQFDATLATFKLLGKRDNWSPPAAAPLDFRGIKHDYRILDLDRIWAENKTRKPDDEHPDCDLLLTAVVRRPGTDRRPAAQLAVVVVPFPGGDPLDAAKSWVQAERGKDPDLYGRTTFDPAHQEGGVASADATPVARLRTRNSLDSVKSDFVVVSGVKQEKDGQAKLILVQCWCPWADRASFAPNFVQVAGSLRGN